MLTLMRLALMVVATAPIFAGFGLPFFVPGWPGFAFGGALVVGGAALFWVVLRRTQAWLDADTAANRLLKADGESLLDDRADPEARGRNARRD